MRNPKTNMLENLNDKRVNIVKEQDDIMEQRNESFQVPLEEQIKGKKIEKQRAKNNNQQKEVMDIRMDALEEVIQKMKMRWK